MKPVITNIFCIMGQPGSGKGIILQNLLNETEFITKYNVYKLIYGTTRPMRYNDIENVTYHFYTKEEYDNIDKAEIIESRSYDNATTEDIYYFFTLFSHIKYGSNNIGKVSFFQYEELKKWALRNELANPMHRINLFSIIVNTSLFEREKRLVNDSVTENDIYEICARLLSERYEFEMVLKTSPEIIDSLNPDTCTINNLTTEERNITLAVEQIKSFIKQKLYIQGI